MSFEEAYNEFKIYASKRHKKQGFVTIDQDFSKHDYLRKYGSFSDDYFVFGGLKPLAPTTIDRYKKEAYIKAKLPCITQHEFRHSYATRKIHKNVPIDVVSRSMGHSKVSTTLDIYLHQEKNTMNVFFS